MDGTMKKKEQVTGAGVEPCANGIDAHLARYVCDADIPCCVESSQATHSVLPYELLIKVLDSGPMAVALFSEGHNPVYWNSQFTSFFESLENVCTDTLYRERSSLWRCVGKYMQEIYETRTDASHECCKLSEHGTYVWFDIRTQVLTLENSTKAYLFVAADVTHQKTAQISLKQTRDELEERVKERTAILAKVNNTLEAQIAQSKQQQLALIESEERFRSIFLNNHGVRFLWDSETFCVEEANIGAAEFYGYELDDLKGRSMQEVTGMPISAIQDRMEEVNRTGQITFTAMHRQAEGEMGYAEMFFVSTRNKGRRLLYSFTVDISERIEAERKLHEQQNHLKALMNSMSDCAMLIDPHGDVITLNHAAVQEFNCRDAESCSVNLFDELHESVVDIWRGAFDSVLVMGMAEHIETDYNRCWNVSFYPVFTESLDISAVAVYAEDVTFEKRTAEQMKMLSKRVLSAQEDERKRIGRELHDSTAQTISGIKYLLESEVARMSQGGEADSGKLVKMIELLQGAIVELRHIIMDLRPTILDDLGLVSALRWLLNEASTMHPAFSFSCSFDLQEHVFSELQKTVLFRVAQEALSNAVKHCKGSSIFLHLKLEENSCVLYVQDNGIGFLVDDCSRSGVGLGSMRERVELANGTLDILSHGGEGTLVRAAVPL